MHLNFFKVLDKTINKANKNWAHFYKIKVLANKSIINERNILEILTIKNAEK